MQTVIYSKPSPYLLAVFRFWLGQRKKLTRDNQLAELHRRIVAARLS